MKKIYSQVGSVEQSIIDYATQEARKATCLRSKCGTVIVKNEEIIGTGFNSPPAGQEAQRRCLRKKEVGPGFKSDRTCCIHAEQRAIMDALRKNPDKIIGSTLYFIRLDENGFPKRSGEPYCTHCSKLALDSGVAEFVLWRDGELSFYKTDEYNDLSYKFGKTT